MGSSGFVNTSISALPDDPDALAWLIAVEVQSGYTLAVRLGLGEVTAHVGTQPNLTEQASVDIDERFSDLWLQILLDGEGTAFLQYSTDGVSYETLLEIDVPPVQGLFEFALVGERTSSIFLPGSIRFESFAASICD